MNEYTKNRKLILNEYDDDGNLIDIREFNDEELIKFLNLMYLEYKPLKVARINHLKKFTYEELKLMDKIIRISQLWELCGTGKALTLESDKDVVLFKEIFKIPKEILEMALEMSHPQQYYFITSLNSHYRKKYSFIEAIRFIEGHEGIYYVVDNEGNKTWDFVDKPTLKQYKYQVKKNGRRTVFLSFKDWKEYIVNESDLK